MTSPYNNNDTPVSASSASTTNMLPSGLGHSTPLVTLPSSSVVGTGIVRHPQNLETNKIQSQPQPTTKTTNHPLTLGSDDSPAPTAVTVTLPPPPNRPLTAPVPVALSPTFPSTPASKIENRVVPPPHSASLDELADAFLSGSSARKPNPLPEDEEGLKRLHTLVELRAWGDVLQVTGKALRSTSSPHASMYATLLTEEDETMPSPPSAVFDKDVQKETVEILTLECHAWLKLRRYTDLAREVKKWKFRNVKGTQFFPSESKSRPLAISPSLRILGASTLQYTDANPKQCIDALNTLRDELSKGESPEIWLTSIDHTLSNAFIRQNEWRLALFSLDNLWDNLPKAIEHEVLQRWTKSNEKNVEYDLVFAYLMGAYKCEVLSRQGRIMLQAGALQEASILFEEATKQWSDTTANVAVSNVHNGVSEAIQERVEEFMKSRHVTTTLLTNDGLLCFSHSDHDKAMSYLSKAVEYQRSHIRDERPHYRIEDWVMGHAVVGTGSNQAVLSECCNSMSLCALYTCRMREAVQVIESLIREDPTAYLTEGLAFNLCTLYELGHDPAVSIRQKRVLQLIAKRFFLHDIGPESFRVG